MGLARAWAVGALLVIAASCGGAAGPPPSVEPPPVSATLPAPSSEPASSAPAAIDHGSAPLAASGPAAPAETPAGPPSTFVEDVLAPAPTPAPAIGLSSPRKDALLDAAKAPDEEVHFKLSNWKLEAGRGVELVLDDRVSLIVTDASRQVHLKDIDPSPAAFAPGQHLLVALLRGPTGQWVRPAGRARAPVAVVSYYVGRRSAPSWKEGAPLLVYTSPPAGPAPAEGLLVDYYLLNAELGAQKYSIHASVTGPGLMTGKVIDSWKPWRILGARQGSYTVRLELDRYQHDLGDSGSSTTVVLTSRPVDGRWASVTRDFDLPPPR
jgi:hypothetical protein